jgi:hypothetical protein
VCERERERGHIIIYSAYSVVTIFPYVDFSLGFQPILDAAGSSAAADSKQSTEQ